MILADRSQGWMTAQVLIKLSTKLKADENGVSIGEPDNLDAKDSTEKENKTLTKVLDTDLSAPVTFPLKTMPDGAKGETSYIKGST
jgi:hypothetical protein